MRVCSFGNPHHTTPAGIQTQRNSLSSYVPQARRDQRDVLAGNAEPSSLFAHGSSLSLLSSLRSSSLMLARLGSPDLAPQLLQPYTS